MRITIGLHAPRYEKVHPRVLYGLALAIGLFLLSLGAPRLFALLQDGHVPTGSREPLEIRLSKPPQWVNGCLSISLDRINRSNGPLFLPDMGLYISVSVRDVSDLTGQTGGQQWINVYGATDIIDWNAREIAAGATVHDEHCLDPQVAVTNFKAETRREIPLRGKLRIDAGYFPTAKAWQQSKSSHELMAHTPPDQWGKIARHDARVVTMFADIPCRESSCAPGCDDPPIIVHGENLIVPDLAPPDWETRGKAITDELTHRFPACSEVKTTP